jgi:hypothetical protein
MMRSYGRAGFLALLSLGVLISWTSTSSAGVCLFDPPSFTIPFPGVCGEVSVNGDGPAGPVATNASPGTPANFVSPVGGAAALSGAGAGLSGSGDASGILGVLHADAVANISVPLPYNGTNASEFDGLNVLATAGFGDTGVLNSSSLAAGQPVNLKVTIKADGAFAGGGGTVDLVLFRNGVHVITPQEFSLGPTVTSLDITDNLGTVRVGDHFSFYFQIQAGAGVRDDFPSYVPFTTAADMSNTGELFLDVLTPGVTFDSVSGHDYSTDAAIPTDVPEPGSMGLMLAALVGVGSLRRRKAA